MMEMRWERAGLVSIFGSFMRLTPDFSPEPLMTLYQGALGKVSLVTKAPKA